ncbi:MAG: hypothetical protein J0I42_21060, partial [Bosea sp.]|uniref:hypothetical protein n=1 Tax=Bosea sp. (in: a-proteobacteria) TaxID=1871050 RepID=UPI001ACD1B75
GTLGRSHGLFSVCGNLREIMYRLALGRHAKTVRLRPAAQRRPVSGAGKACGNGSRKAAEKTPGQPGMVVQRGKILRRRQGRQMALCLHGAEALRMMLTRRHG